MSEARPFSRVVLLGTVEDCMPDAEFRCLARQLSATAHVGTEPTLVVARASEPLRPDRVTLPDWVNTETRYLVVLDVPEPAVLRLASTLRLHKPDRRLQGCAGTLQL